MSGSRSLLRPVLFAFISLLAIFPAWSDDVVLIDGTIVRGDIILETSGDITVNAPIAQGGFQCFYYLKSNTTSITREARDTPMPPEQAEDHGLIPRVVHQVSEFRFFYAIGLLAFGLLTVWSTTKPAPRRLFGTICLIGVAGLVYYLLIGVMIPPTLPKDTWRGPEQREMGLRSEKEWAHVPEGSFISVIRQNNFLGPKNTTSLDDWLKLMIQNKSPGVPIQYRKDLISGRIRWRTATAWTPDKTIYVWAAEFKQTRVAVVLRTPGGWRISYLNQDFQDALALVKAF